MPLAVGASHGLAAWNAYDWSRSYRYLSAWTPSVTPTSAPKEVTLAVASQPAGSNTATDQHRVLWSRRSGGGYECASRRMAGTVTSFRLLDLQPATTYYAVRVWHYANGAVARSPEFTFSTA